MKHADGSQTEMDTSESLFDRRRGARKGLFLPHSQRGKFKDIQGIKMRYNIGINHGKSPSACRLGLPWVYTDPTGGSAKTWNLFLLQQKPPLCLIKIAAVRQE